jgi:Ca2+-binding EF-hand superfamily protein
MANTVSYPFGLRQSASCGKFRKSMLAWLFGISALCWLGESNRLYAQFGPPEGDRGRDRGDRGDRGGRGGFDPSEMIRRMDQNGDGLITANEVERVPSFIRDRWTQQGLDLNRGVRVDDMASNAQRQMEEFRRQREEEGRGREERSDRPEFQPAPEMGRGDSRPATSNTVPNAKPRTRIAPLLPESYKPLDMDYDGQIALFEWRKGKRGTISQFNQQDFDGDGFLTAKELAKAPAPAAAPTTTSPGTPAATTASVAPVPTAPAAPQAPVTVSAEAATKASRAFDILDSDRKGTVEGKEWDQSSRLKPLFQKAGYDLSKPLNKEEFTQAYVRAGADM